MEKIQSVIRLVLIAALVIVGFLFALDFRYRMVGIPDYRSVYVLDSWTGKLSFCRTVTSSGVLYELSLSCIER